jgi:hypothetical protein
VSIAVLVRVLAQMQAYVPMLVLAQELEPAWVPKLLLVQDLELA